MPILKFLVRIISPMFLSLLLLACDTSPRIATPDGDLLIKDLYLTDRFPPGCTPPRCNRKAKAGYKIVSFRLERTDGGLLSSEVYDRVQDMFQGAYISTESGQIGDLVGTTHQHLFNKDHSPAGEKIHVVFAISSDVSGSLDLVLPNLPGSSRVVRIALPSPRVE